MMTLVLSSSLICQMSAIPDAANSKSEVNMTGKANKSSFLTLNKENKNIWSKNADFWDQRMGDRGNEFHRILIEPTQDQLLGLKQGEWVLDIACGNGQYARHMLRQRVHIVAFDFSKKVIRRAKLRTKKFTRRIAFKVIDATKRKQLMILGKAKFDAAVCTMGLMDIADVRPLLSSLSALLKPDGRFVFSVMHPCFNSLGARQLLEVEERDNSIINHLSIKVFKYITPRAEKGVGIVGQPVGQYYFHRPLYVLLNTCFDAGFVLDRVEEPTFPRPLDKSKAWSWSQCSEIPPVLVVRMHL